MHQSYIKMCSIIHDVLQDPDCIKKNQTAGGKQARVRNSQIPVPWTHPLPMVFFFFSPHFLFHYNPHFCYPPFHPVFLCLLVWSYCSLGFDFMQKPKSLSNLEPQRQPRQDGSIRVFSSRRTNCLWESQQGYESGTPDLCVTSVATRVFCRDQAEVLLKESFTFMPQESLHPCKCNLVHPSPQQPWFPWASPVFLPKGRHSGTTLYITANEVALFVLLLRGIT